MNDIIKDQAIYWAACKQEGLTKTQQNDFENWIIQNEEHKTAFEEAENIYSIFQNVPRKYTEKTSKIAHNNSKRRRIYNTLKPFIAYAATFLIIFLFSCKAYDYYTPTFEANYISSNHMKSTILPDGSTITMDNKTQIEVTFYNNRRNVVLNSGQAFFDVAPNKEKVFSIDVNNLQIQVIGTSFEVKKNENDTKVTVREGVVKVSHVYDHHNKLILLARLEKGDSLSVNRKGKIKLFNKVKISEIAPWRESKLIFSNNSLQEAFDDFSRYNDFKLESNIDLTSISFSGVFEEYDMDKFLNVLQNIYSFQIKKQNNKIILSQK